MKKKRTVQKVAMAIGVFAMSLGLFNTFGVKAEEEDPVGVCCQQEDVECYNYKYHVLVADA